MTYQVPSPMERPDYAFEKEPTVEEMRARAVQAIQDFLNIQWRTHQKIAHSKVGAVSHKRFIYEADNTYAGIPYTDAGMGIFQFYEYYDEETGRLKFYGDGVEFNQKIGGTCACGVCCQRENRGEDKKQAKKLLQFVHVDQILPSYSIR